MSHIISAQLVASKKRVAIAVSRFNDFVTVKLLEGAKDGLLRHGMQEDEITVAWVPGAFELPLVAQKLAETKMFDAIICLGAVIRGSTPHFDYVAGEAAKGINNVGLKYGIPVIFGVITTNTVEQAIERAGIRVGNKGWEAAVAAVEMMNVVEEVNHISRGSHVSHTPIKNTLKHNEL
jgi:6,7-dimethyl-8-ribityllumazine synthase